MSENLRSILRNDVREKLARDELAVSMTVRLVRGIEIERTGKTAGFRSFLSQTGVPSARRPNEPV
jgi:hypothetical protein